MQVHLTHSSSPKMIIKLLPTNLKKSQNYHIVAINYAKKFPFRLCYCRNVLHAFYAIAEADGLPALQRELFPAVLYQVTLNGPKLGAYQVSVLQLLRLVCL